MRRAASLITVALLASSLWRAWDLRWTCDDAFISFRYAEHLVQGEGLVYVPGEHVEGYTNLSWTLALAATTALGLDPLQVAQGLGLLSLLALGLAMWRLSARWSGADAPPIALWVLLLTTDALIWTTGGLETMTVAALTAWIAALLFASADPPPKHRLAAGALGALLVLTRPDSPLLIAGLTGGFALTRPGLRPKIRALLETAAPGVVALIALTAFRLAYYGDWLPNTYYAKSASEPWWEQGMVYLELFVWRNHVFLWLPAVSLAALAARGHREHAPAWTATILGGTAAAFSLYVARSGGDFMFARRLIPAVPLLLLACEIPLARLRWPRARWAVALVAACGAALPLPIYETEARHGMIDGVADEHAFYTADILSTRQQQGEALGRAFDGLDATLLLEGGLCSLAWYSHLPDLIEGNGLTDATIARQPLPERSRPGHEKQPTAAYLAERGVQLTVLHEIGPPRPTTVLLEEGPLQLELLRWDADLMTALAARPGVRFLSIDRIVDVVAGRMAREPCPLARRGFAWLDSFYLRENDGTEPTRRRLEGILQRQCGG